MTVKSSYSKKFLITILVFFPCSYAVEFCILKLWFKGLVSPQLLDLSDFVLYKNISLKKHISVVSSHPVCGTLS